MGKDNSAQTTVEVQFAFVSEEEREKSLPARVFQLMLLTEFGRVFRDSAVNLLMNLHERQIKDLEPRDMDAQIESDDGTTISNSENPKNSGNFTYHAVISKKVDHELVGEIVEDVAGRIEVGSYRLHDVFFISQIVLGPIEDKQG